MMPFTERGVVGGNAVITGHRHARLARPTTDPLNEQSVTSGWLYNQLAN